MVAKPRNVLGEESRPRFFRVGGPVPGSLDASANGATVRVWARSLAGMQKEVLVKPAPDAPLWRLVSDEGPYLDGYDEGPFPLAHMTTGLVAAYTDELLTLRANVASSC